MNNMYICIEYEFSWEDREFNAEVVIVFRNLEEIRSFYNRDVEENQEIINIKNGTFVSIKQIVYGEITKIL